MFSTTYFELNHSHEKMSENDQKSQFSLSIYMGKTKLSQIKVQCYNEKNTKAFVL